MGLANVRKAIALRSEGLTYREIALRLGVSESWALRLAQQPIAKASPMVLKAALTQCEALARQLEGRNLATILAALEVRWRPLVPTDYPGPSNNVIARSAARWRASAGHRAFAIRQVPRRLHECR